MLLSGEFSGTGHDEFFADRVEEGFWFDVKGIFDVM
jgi:hypothetical protein